MQKLKRANQAKPGVIQVIADYAETIPEVPAASNIEKRRKSDKNLDPVDEQKLAQGKRENREHPVPVLQAQLQ